MPGRSLGIEPLPAGPAPRISGPLALGLLLLVAGAAIRVLHLDHRGFAFCYFKQLTGYACFTCGSTRALGHLARFDPGAAFLIQPLATLGFLVVLAWAACDALLALRSRRLALRLPGRTALWAGLFVAALVVNWFYLLATGV